MGKTNKELAAEPSWGRPLPGSARLYDSARAISKSNLDDIVRILGVVRPCTRPFKSQTFPRSLLCEIKCRRSICKEGVPAGGHLIH